MNHRYLNPIHLASLNKKEIDIIGYFVIAFSFIITVPQAIEIYSTNDASGVSIYTWAGYVIISFYWLIYGIKRKATPIIASSFLYIVVDIFIVIGIIRYS